MRFSFISLILILITYSSCEIENIDYLRPFVITKEPHNVLSNSAFLGGEVIGEGGKDVTEYGVVWSTNNPPTINDFKEIRGTRLGEFFDLYSGFSPNTTYYYSAYGINEVGVSYGRVYQFTTSSEPPCDPVTDNYIHLGDTNNNTLSITDVELSYPDWPFDNGNIEFETSSFSSTAKITVQFNETDNNFPLTGEYTVVSDFGDNNFSVGEAQLYIIDFGLFTPGSATAVPGTKFYVENENNTVTIIFCDTPIGDTYVFNGKFSYNY